MANLSLNSSGQHPGKVPVFINVGSPSGLPLFDHLRSVFFLNSHIL